MVAQRQAAWAHRQRIKKKKVISAAAKGLATIRCSCTSEWSLLALRLLGPCKVCNTATRRPTGWRKRAPAENLELALRLPSRDLALAELTCLEQFQINTCHVAWLLRTKESLPAVGQTVNVGQSAGRELGGGLAPAVQGPGIVRGCRGTRCNAGVAGVGVACSGGDALLAVG